MLLYDNALSGNCYKVRLLAAHLGLELERREVDVFDRSARVEVLGDLNPGLRIPTLVLDDGRSLAESNAIVFHLSEGTEYLPDDPFERAKVLQWMFFEQYSHEPFIAILRFWALAGIERPEASVSSRRASGEAALAGMERHLATAPFLVADRFTVADIALYAYTHVADEAGIDLGGYLAIGEWLARVAAQPGHVPIDT